MPDMFNIITIVIIWSRSALEEDEVYSVARLLGDLVAYRASGTGHLELLAGPVSFVQQKFHDIT